MHVSDGDNRIIYYLIDPSCKIYDVNYICVWLTFSLTNLNVYPKVGCFQTGGVEGDMRYN